MDNIKIDFKPSVEDFNKLMKLLEEYKFYNGILQPHDESKIRKSFSRNGFIAHYNKEEPIGFTVWNGEKQCAEIEYKWIVSTYRNKGLGGKFAQLRYEEFVKRNIYYVVAQPATPCGDGMANHFGFKPLSDTDYRFSTSMQYLFIKRNRPQSIISNEGYELLIWHDWNDGREPAQIYKLDETMREFPIITIVDTDAAVQIRKDGVPIKRNICKHIFTENECQNYGLFFFSTNISDWLISNGLG